MLLLLVGIALGADNGRWDRVEFVRDVAPILESHCLKCHKPGDEKGGLSLATPEGLRDGEHVVAGKPEESYLIDLVAEPEGGGRPEMPKSGAPLSADQVEILRTWIAQGADWPEGLTLVDRSRADRSWWSLRPLRADGPPEARGAPETWRKHPIDRFVYGKLAEKGLRPNEKADRRTLIRRLSYDLTGLPPSPEDVEQFEADHDPMAYEHLVDRLLASPRYGERWARHWLDVVRFGESRGFERNEIIPNAWPFRDYVIRSLNEDKPFDRMVIEHLAGDVVGPNDPAVEVGTAFLVAGPYDDVGNQDPAQAAQIRANTVDDMIVATGSAFLGLTIGCARCHDHKFDPIAQVDYYRWYATFDGVRHGSREVATDDARKERAERLAPLEEKRDALVNERAELLENIWKRTEARAAEIEAGWTRPPASLTGVEELFEPVDARALRLVVDGTDSNPEGTSGYHLDEIEVWTAEVPSRNVALAELGTKAEGAYRVAEDFAEAYSPAQAIDGKIGATWVAAGPTLTLTFPRVEKIHRVVFSSNREGNFHRTFPAEYRVEVSTDGQSWVEVASGRDRKPVSDRHRRHRLIQGEMLDDERSRRAELDRRIAEVNGQIGAVPPLPSWWVGQFAQPPGPTHVFKGGDPQKRGEEVVAGSLSTLEHVAPPYRLPADAPEGQRRLALARWIVDPANPLTPRVLANRLWHYHFGKGIVDTPSDFGFMGGQPSHPDLLDWLATQVHENGWRLKPLHRLIVTSETYQQAGTFRAEAASVDAADRSLWRFPPRRLEAEELRDTFLSLAGVLDLSMGGPGFRLYRYLQDNVSTYIPLEKHGPETYRRAIYHQNARAAPVDLLSEFDCPDNAFSAPRRDQTTTPLQALTLLNHPFTTDMARAMADRLVREAGDDRLAQVERAYQLAYGRKPDSQELGLADSFIREHGLPAFCRALLNSNELMYLD